VSIRDATSTSEAETRAIASTLAADLEPGTIVLLSGDLGAGKTAFVRGLAEGLGIDPGDVTSPTLPWCTNTGGGRVPLIHVDLYRLEQAVLDEVGLDQDLADAGITAIEWPERLTRVPRGAMAVTIFDLGADRRSITIGA